MCKHVHEHGDTQTYQARKGGFQSQNQRLLACLPLATHQRSSRNRAGILQEKRWAKSDLDTHALPSSTYGDPRYRSSDDPQRHLAGCKSPRGRVQEKTLAAAHLLSDLPYDEATRLPWLALRLGLVLPESFLQ